jgi:hypothetical protein
MTVYTEIDAAELRCTTHRAAAWVTTEDVRKTNAKAAYMFKDGEGAASSVNMTSDELDTNWSP